MNKEIDVLNIFKELKQGKKIESKLNETLFIHLYKEAVRDIFPKIIEKYNNQLVYGISFEIANVVQRIFSESYYTMIYLNTEERYQKMVETCAEEKKNYYRFNAWAEWRVEEASSRLFNKVQEYLFENSLIYYDEILISMSKSQEEEMSEWYEKVEYEIVEAQEKERKVIRGWLAKAIGELRREGFWEKQGNPEIYVIPFGGEEDISIEEMIETFEEMDQGYHDMEYLNYLKGC